MNADVDAAPEKREFGYLQSDEPIKHRWEDRLNRTRLAEAVADQVIYSPPAHGFVIALDGPWGSGKTSVLNMIEEVVAEKSETVVLRFNPWLFSGAEELVVRFLAELGAQLEEKADAANDGKLRAAAQTLGSYGEVLEPFVWVPVAGPWLARLGSLAKVAGRRAKEKQPESAFSQRKRVTDNLRELDRRVLVVVDDLDRIAPEQIRDVVRLIKLVGDFPNVTYLLAYDGDKVAGALADDVSVGHDYLEKIVQVTHHLPEIADWSLVELLQRELYAALLPIEHGPFSEADWVNVFHTAMRPFFTNVRDVRRYLNAVPVTLRVLGDEVALVDALTLETLRVFTPSAYVKLPSMVATLTGEGISAWGDGGEERERADAEAIQELVTAAAPHEEAVKTMLQRLFPRIGRHVGGTTISGGEARYQRERRVAHPDVLRFYLRQTLPEGATPTRLVEEAFGLMGQRERFTELLESVEPSLLEDLLDRLLAYQPDYDPAATEVAIEVLLNQMPRLREERRGMFDFGAEFAVTRVVLRALERITDEQERLAIIKRVLPRVRQLSGRMELLDLAGHRENAGHRLIPEDDANELYQEVHEQLLSADPSDLARERQLLSLFFWAIEQEKTAEETEEADGRKRLSELCDDDGVLLRLLRSAYGERRRQQVGDLYVRTIPMLPWKELAEVAGGEDRLKARLTELAERVVRDDLDERTRLALEAAERYVTGDLPEDDDF